MNGQPPADYVATPAAGRRLSPATAIWIIGGIEVLLFGGCVGLMAVAAALPADEFASQPRPEGITIEQMQMAMGLIAVVLGLLIVLPGLALLGLGWAVQNGSAGAAKVARWILLAQAAVVGLLTLGNVVLGLLMGNVLDVLFQVLIFGAFIALLVWGVWVLRPTPGDEALGDAAGEPSPEPWNDHLPR